MSQSIGVSRQTLYAWKANGQRALEAAFAPKQPQAVVTKRVELHRVVLTLLIQAHASYRGIQACLKELLGLEVSLGTITAIVQAAGQRAQGWLQQQVVGQGRMLALDEQYSSKRSEAYLNIVDVHSGQVWATLPPVAVDGESWILALWCLHEQGIVVDGTVSDGGRAIIEALSTIKEQTFSTVSNPAPTAHLITSDHSGNIWYSQGFAGQIGEWIPSSRKYTNIVVSTASFSHISGISMDSENRIWFDDSLNAVVGYYDSSTGNIKTFTSGNHPHDGLAVDSNDNVWFTEEFAGTTGRLAELPADTL